MLKENVKIAIMLHGSIQEFHIWESNPRKQLQPGERKNNNNNNNYICEDVHRGVSYSRKKKKNHKEILQQTQKEMIKSVMTLSS